MGQLVGLTSVRVGEPIKTGITGSEAITGLMKITQPYQGGVTTNFAIPSSTEFFRENETDPFYSAVDPTSATKKLTWEVADFDENTLAFYFGTTEAESGTIYEGIKAFAFDTKSGYTLAFARLKYVATLTGAMNTGEPLRISVEATVLAPETSGKAWWPVATPTYTGGDWTPTTGE